MGNKSCERRVCVDVFLHPCQSCETIKLIQNQIIIGIYNYFINLLVQCNIIAHQTLHLCTMSIDRIGSLHSLQTKIGSRVNWFLPLLPVPTYTYYMYSHCSRESNVKGLPLRPLHCSIFRGQESVVDTLLQSPPLNSRNTVQCCNGRLSSFICWASWCGEFRIDIGRKLSWG